MGVAGRGGGAEVAADACRVADLRRADRAGRHGQARADAARARAIDPRVGDAGAEPEPAVVAAPLAQLGHAAEVEQRLGPAAVEVELDHHVGAAGEGPRPGLSLAQGECLIEARRREDPHRSRMLDPR